MTSVSVLWMILAGWTGLASPPECAGETVVEPGRWLVESKRAGEAPAAGRAEIVRLGPCLLLERLVLHMADGSSHLVVFVQGWDPSSEEWVLVQIGDHPLFLVWDERETGAGERYETIRRTPRGEVGLQWQVSGSDDGFRRDLLVRGPGQAEWEQDEEMTYWPVRTVEDPADLPALLPGPFHEPDACGAGGFRDMDHLIGHWLNEEWVRTEAGAWRGASVSEVTVEAVVAGCALMETHPVYENGELSDRLLILRGYEPDADRWRQVVFGYAGGVWEWQLEEAADGWRLTPASGDAAGGVRILERPGPDGLTRTVEVLHDSEGWEVVRVIRYVPW